MSSVQIFSDDGSTPVDISSFSARRQRLVANMLARGGGIAIIPTAPERTRNRDAEYPYRFDSYFHYLTAFREPKAVLVLIADASPRSILFCREKDKEREIWDGYCYGPDMAREALGFDEAFTVGDLVKRLPDLVLGQSTLWYSLGHDSDSDRIVLDALNAVRANTRAGHQAPHCIQDVRTVLDEMRLFKDPDEIATMRRAGEINAEAHRRAMTFCRPEQFEYQLAAEILHTFHRHGCRAPAYNSIVASGPNACILHYVENSRRMCPDDLLMIDAGCELDGYASDISRTFPVSGRFSAAQRDVYEIVLAAQHAAREMTRPGIPWNKAHDAAVRVIAQGLLDLGLLHGSLDSIIEQGLFQRFYMHRTGHWLGRDVHDAGEYRLDGQWRPLEPGMVLTIEPGCYIRAAEDIPEAFWNIGIRIEDDALVTQEGCEYLTDNVPRTIADIEALMNRS